MFIAFLTVSCNSNIVYSSYQNLPKIWHKDSIVTFNINLKDSINPYNLFITLRNTNDYKYNNIFLIAETVFPHGKTLKDTLEYKMAKPNGAFLGEGLYLKENKLWYKENSIFTEQGSYKINIQQAMRTQGEINGIEQLNGITDVGLTIEKAVKAQ